MNSRVFSSWQILFVTSILFATVSAPAIGAERAAPRSYHTFDKSELPMGAGREKHSATTGEQSEHCFICLNSMTDKNEAVGCDTHKTCRKCYATWARAQLEEYSKSQSSPFVRLVDGKMTACCMNLSCKTDGERTPVTLELSELTDLVQKLEEEPQAQCSIIPSWLNFLLYEQVAACLSLPNAIPLFMWSLIKSKYNGALHRCGDFYECECNGKYFEYCPRCGARIQRDGGCPHMVCKRCHLSFTRRTQVNIPLGVGTCHCGYCLGLSTLIQEEEGCVPLCKNACQTECPTFCKFCYVPVGYPLAVCCNYTLQCPCSAGVHLPCETYGHVTSHSVICNGCAQICGCSHCGPLELKY